VYLKSIDIENLRCFAAADASFSAPNGRQLSNINLLLGDNGSGKSTVLKAIALVLLGATLGTSGFRPFHLVRRGKMREWAPGVSVAKEHELKIEAEFIEEDRPLVARVALRPVGEEDVLLPQKTGYGEGFETPDELYKGDVSRYFLCGYGSNRLSEKGHMFDASDRLKGRSVRYQRVSSLFDEGATLVPFSQVLQRAGLEDERREEIRQVLDTLLEEHLVTFSGISLGETQYFTDSRGIHIPFGALSDGYQAFLSWVGDLLYQLCTVTPAGVRLAATQGIVLIDEIDTFLHPNWQRTVLAQVSLAFPSLQFFVTSHSPILAGTVEPDNLYVCESVDGKQVIRKASEGIYGKTAEDILLSSYFGLKSTRAPRAAEERRQLLERREEAARRLLQENSRDAAHEYLELLEAESD